jgi:molecular chaperone GrpE
MTDTIRGESEPVTAETIEQPPGGAETFGPEGAGGEAAPVEHKGSDPDRAEALAKEAAELKDRLLRTLADMENLRRRTEREVADARAYGISALARDMIGVADNMQRALEAAPPELREREDAALKAFVEGVELTERELLKALEKHGVRKFDPKGEKFDPHVHQAMFEVPDPNATSGTVAQVVQPGYMIGERVLRPALVGVAKGGPKPGARKRQPGPSAGQGRAADLAVTVSFHTERKRSATRKER